MKSNSIYARVFGDKHMTKELPFNTKAFLTHVIIYLQRKIFSGKKGYGAYSYMPTVLSIDETIDLIIEKIRSGTPFVAGKIGTGDGEALARYFDITANEHALQKALKMTIGKRGPFWWDNSVRAAICRCAGVFPITDESIEKFCDIFIDACQYIDGFASFNPGEFRLHQTLCPTAASINLNALAPQGHPRTWYRAIEGKTLLVVHPYAKTIQTQYEKNVEYHVGQGAFPRLKKLITYVPVIWFNAASQFEKSSLLPPMELTGT